MPGPGRREHGHDRFCYLAADDQSGAGSDAGDLLGESVALSADGSTLAVGAIREDSAATGVGGDPSDDAAVNAGAVYVYH